MAPNNKVKFRVGDKIQIARFPMKMHSGDRSDPREWHKEKTIFTIRRFNDEYNFAQNGQIPCIYVEECGWYFDISSIKLASGYKRPKEVKSWILK